MRLQSTRVKAFSLARCLGKVQATFLFDPLKAGIALVVILCHQGATRMPIAHGGIAEVKKGVIGQIIAREVIINIFGVPVEDRQDFMEIALAVDEVEGLAVLGLVAPESGKPSGGLQVLERPLHGFNFADLVVAVEGIEIVVLPEFAVEGFHARRGERGLIHLEVEAEALGEVGSEAIGFRGEIAGVNPNDGNVGND